MKWSDEKEFLYTCACKQTHFVTYCRNRLIMPLSFDRIYIDLFCSFFGAFVGFSSFLVLTFYSTHHYIAGLLALLAGTLSFITFHLNRLYYKDILRDWYTFEIMQSFQTFGFTGGLIGLTFFLWSLFIQLYYEFPINSLLSGTCLRMLFSFLTIIYGATLYFTSKSYSKIIEETQSLLPHPTRHIYS